MRRRRSIIKRIRNISERKSIDLDSCNIASKGHLCCMLLYLLFVVAINQNRLGVGRKTSLDGVLMDARGSLLRDEGAWSVVEGSRGLLGSQCGVQGWPAKTFLAFRDPLGSPMTINRKLKNPPKVPTRGEGSPNMFARPLLNPIR